ncbi:hypothetical protein PCL1606_28830 [Pseudomonas chlororaphis]|uniref:Uncharacterized protein n=1 Tax=Pseudomonas chlororaphis TaxID=587753 RepID=A0A0D5XZ23_9PSED|nr:hypothetical protein PCL1606_28830 [Pseudomonas chlororaphis]
MQYAIIQHLFTLVKFDMQIIIINKSAQLLIRTYLEIYIVFPGIS